MDILIGENCSIDSGEIIFNKTNIESFNPQKRRNLSIAFVPENRLGHSAVPELNTFRKYTIKSISKIIIFLNMEY